MVKLTPVVSTNIKAIGWEKNVLYVEFDHGGVYSYNGVTEEKYQEFLKAESKGSFFHKNIKSNFTAFREN